MLGRHRKARAERRKLNELLARADRDGELAGEAVDRRVPVLKERADQIAESPLDEFFQACLQCAEMAAYECLVKLPFYVAQGTRPDNPQEDLYVSLQRMAQDDDVFWPIWSVVRWGYVAELTASSWPDRYEETIELAQVALPAPNEREREVIEYGPLIEDEPERFEMRLLRNVCELLGEDKNTAAQMAVAMLLSYWPDAREDGWGVFQEVLSELFPDGPPAPDAVSQ